MFTAQSLNHVYRALDIYNFPDNIPVIKQLQALRVLHENRNAFRNLIPTAAQIQSRLEALSTQAPLHPQTQNELDDTAWELGIVLPHRVPVEPVTVKSKPKDIFSFQEIVQDSQNVHHSSINEHMKDLVLRLTQDFPVGGPVPQTWGGMRHELLKPGRDWKPTNADSLKFIYENTCTFGIGTTLKQLILSVYLFILSHSLDIQEQLFQRMNQELHDMRKMCSTGHLARLVNILQGFSDRYNLHIQPEQEMKTYVYQYLNKKLMDAPDAVQEGMVDQTPAFREFVLAEKHLEAFVIRFGTDHRVFLEKCIREFLG